MLTSILAKVDVDVQYPHPVLIVRGPMDATVVVVAAAPPISLMLMIKMIS